MNITIKKERTRSGAQWYMCAQSVQSPGFHPQYHYPLKQKEDDESMAKQTELLTRPSP